tara:strand:+ start:728 stop:877 length:150 start_codon:yes stop_codon:yes gene_type:complete
MAFEIHNATTIGITLVIAELLFWFFVGFGLLKLKKKRKNKWESAFDTQK